jgi:hypothetical protein
MFLKHAVARQEELLTIDNGEREATGSRACG